MLTIVSILLLCTEQGNKSWMKFSNSDLFFFKRTDFFDFVVFFLVFHWNSSHLSGRHTGLKLVLNRIEVEVYCSATELRVLSDCFSRKKKILANKFTFQHYFLFSSYSAVLRTEWFLPAPRGDETKKQNFYHSRD